MIEILKFSIHKTDKHNILKNVILKLCDSEPLQLEARGRSYSVWIMRTNVWLDLSDPKRSRPDEAC